MSGCYRVFFQSFQKDAKYDPELEQEARVWMEAVVGEPICPVSFDNFLSLLYLFDSNMSNPFKDMSLNLGSKSLKVTPYSLTCFERLPLYKDHTLHKDHFLIPKISFPRNPNIAFPL